MKPAIIKLSSAFIAIASITLSLQGATAQNDTKAIAAQENNGSPTSQIEPFTLESLSTVQIAAYQKLGSFLKEHPYVGKALEFVRLTAVNVREKEIGQIKKNSSSEFKRTVIEGGKSKFYDSLKILFESSETQIIFMSIATFAPEDRNIFIDRVLAPLVTTTQSTSSSQFSIENSLLKKIIGLKVINEKTTLPLYQDHVVINTASDKTLFASCKTLINTCKEFEALVAHIKAAIALVK